MNIRKRVKIYQHATLLITQQKVRYFIFVVGAIFLLRINTPAHRTITHLQIPWFDTQVYDKISKSTGLYVLIMACHAMVKNMARGTQVEENRSRRPRFLSWLRPEGHVWCAILIAHQLLWQNMEDPVSIFQESPLAGEPRERLFHIHSIHRYQLCAKYLYPSTLLWQMNGCNP